MCFDIKFARIGFGNACLIARQTSQCQKVFSKPHEPCIFYVSILDHCLLLYSLHSENLYTFQNTTLQYFKAVAKTFE